MRPDYTPLSHALEQLEKSLAYAQAPAVLADVGLCQQLRYAVIHCVDVSFALSWQMLRQYLEATEASPAEIKTGTFQSLRLLAQERALLPSDARQWDAYRQASTDSRLSCDATQAEAVFAMAPGFLADAQALLHELKHRSDRHARAMANDAATEAPPIEITPRDWRDVLRILREQALGVEVWAFGSRARRTAKPYSDLDLALIAREPVSPQQLAALADAFETSDLPIRVDVVDWAATSDTFRFIIERDRVVVQTACAGHEGIPHSGNGL